MAYNRPPNVVVVAGSGLKQTPPPDPIYPAGVIQVQLAAEIASTTQLGVIQVGSGLSITPSGILSATGSASGLVPVVIVSMNYTLVASDYYLSATKKEIQITLPEGIVGKVYIIKNKSTGSITVKTTNSQKIDTSLTKNLGSEASLYVIFDGDCWNSI